MIRLADRIPSTVLTAHARQEIAEVHTWQCESCTKMLEEHETRYCWACGEYWKDVENGLFDEIWRDECELSDTPFSFRGID